MYTLYLTVATCQEKPDGNATQVNKVRNNNLKIVPRDSMRRGLDINKITREKGFVKPQDLALREP